jgi:ferrous iron transport protein A
MTEVSLNILLPGERAIITTLSSLTPRVRQRLLELGMTKGALVQLVRVAPMGDPLEIAIKGYRLSLRRVDAESILVRKEN